MRIHRMGLRLLRLSALVASPVLLPLLGLAEGLPDVAWLAAERPTTTAYIELRKREAAARGEAFDLRWTWRDLESISPYLRSAVVESEDWRFWKHSGIDEREMRRVAWTNLRSGRIVGGASTITQQVARNLFLSPDRSFIRKVREVLLAWRLEQSLGKERILELHLNVAEWAEGVFGAEEAARHWFGKSAADLAPVEAARLVVVLPAPRRLSPLDLEPHYAQRARKVLGRMAVDGLLDETQLAVALANLDPKSGGADE